MIVRGYWGGYKFRNIPRPATRVAALRRYGRPGHRAGGGKAKPGFHQMNAIASDVLP